MEPVEDIYVLIDGQRFLARQARFSGSTPRQEIRDVMGTRGPVGVRRGMPQSFVTMEVYSMGGDLPLFDVGGRHQVVVELPGNLTRTFTADIMMSDTMAGGGEFCATLEMQVYGQISTTRNGEPVGQPARAPRNRRHLMMPPPVTVPIIDDRPVTRLAVLDLPEIPNDLDTPAFREAFEKRVAERDRAGRGMTPAAVRNLYGRLRKVVEARGIGHAVACLEKATTNGWRGVVFKDDLQPPTPPPPAKVTPAPSAMAARFSTLEIDEDPPEAVRKAAPETWHERWLEQRSRKVAGESPGRFSDLEEDGD